MDGPVGREIRRGPTMPSSVVVRSLLTVETRSMNFLIELDQLQSSPSPREVKNLHGKRTLDALLILLALPLLIPLALLVTLLIRSGSRGSVLSRQERVGYQSRRFTCCMREKERSSIPLERRIATFTALRTIAGIIAITFFANVGMLEAQTTVVASDNFQRPNGPLGTNWATPLAGLAPYSYGNLVITNDAVGVNSNDYHCYAYGATNTFSDNQYSQAIITSIGPWTGVIVRADTNQDMFYLGFVYGPSDYRIYARCNGAYYELATGSAVTWHVGDTLKLEISGSVNQVTLSMYQNGTPVLMWRSTLPAQVFTGGSPGIGIYSPSGDNLTIGSWKGGDLDPDTNAPTIPANLVASVVGMTNINLSWKSATDNVGVVGYLVERSQGAGSTNFFLLDTPTGTNYSDAESTTLYTIYTTNSAVLLPGTTYNYMVMAIDAAGNVSGSGQVVSATTPIPPLPTITVIANLTTLAGISLGPFPIYISDPGVTPTPLIVTATSLNTNLVPNENLFVYY